MMFKASVYALAAGTLYINAANVQATGNKDFDFDLVPAKGIVNSGCLPEAKGKVSILPLEGTRAGKLIGPNEILSVAVEGLVPNTDYDFFVLQVPEFPFGLSWYQGDIHTNKYGYGYAKFAGRFNEETFIVSPDAAPAPQVHTTPRPDAIPDASVSVQVGPVHTYHLGLWFNSPDDALNAGCTDGKRIVTPFNGEHNAGPQVLNTSNFKQEGPLFNVKP